MSMSNVCKDKGNEKMNANGQGGKKENGKFRGRRTGNKITDCQHHQQMMSMYTFISQTRFEGCDNVPARQEMLPICFNHVGQADRLEIV